MRRIVASLAVVGALACAPPAGAQDLVVGVSALMTGPSAGTYAPVVEAMRLYFDNVNKAGGINGKQVKLLISDNQADASKAAADAKKFLLQDNALLLLNISLSSTYAPMVAEAKRAETPLLFAGSVCPREVYPKADAFLYCTTAFAAQYDSRFALDFIRKTAKEPVKLGLAAMAIPISRAEIDFAEQQLPSLGFTAAGKEVIPPPTANYTPHATKLKEADANWVYSWAPWGMQVKTLEALRTLGWQGSYIAYAHLNAEDELVRLKDDKLFVFGTNAFFQDDLPIHQAIKARATGASYPVTQLGEGWVAAMALEAILKQAGANPTRASVSKAMNALKVDMQGLRGAPIAWTDDNHFRTSVAYRVYRWDSAQGKVIRVTDWTTFDVK